MRDLTHRNGSLPSEAEMAKALDLSPREYEELLEKIRPATYVCLDSMPVGDGDDERGSHEIIADDSQIDPRERASMREMAALVEDRIHDLPEMQRKVLALYYFEDCACGKSQKPSGSPNRASARFTPRPLQP